MAEVLIDGQFDKTFRGLKSRTVHHKSCFFNATRDKKLEFVFSNSTYDEPSSTSTPNITPRGGIGAISIYFYKGRSVPRQKVKKFSSFDIQQVKLRENKKIFGVQCTTAFEPQNIGNHNCYYDMVKGSNDPIAVLHLHYRPASWFVMRGIQIQKGPHPNLSFDDEKSANKTSNLSPSNKMKDDGMKLDSTIKSEIKDKNHNDHKQIGTIKTEKDKNQNNKRPFNENNRVTEDIDVIDLTRDDVGCAEISGIFEKRARVIDWLNKIK
ncbi:hypothetical protein C1645_788544 [Glomus cerebriforme]|uniref:Uncharacterized protein n=1 Tax=Glomus cerebriforme TaxID=658196 RepID=A0A397S7K5_9GLOM|nr:hypothetical protein C1645_788544 [Glomus cerebriforme]